MHNPKTCNKSKEVRKNLPQKHKMNCYKKSLKTILGKNLNKNQCKIYSKKKTQNMTNLNIHSHHLLFIRKTYVKSIELFNH